MILGTSAAAQLSLGIAALLYYVPVDLALMHQGNSIVLLSCLLWLLRTIPK